MIMKNPDEVYSGLSGLVFSTGVNELLTL